MYTSSGAAIALIRRSLPGTPEPDLFLMALLAKFSGYFPGYSREIVEHHDYLTWAIFEGAYAQPGWNRSTLRSADPRETPDINFAYFCERDDLANDDLRSVVEGIDLRAAYRCAQQF